MSYNGSGTFNINSTGQPVVAGTVITASAFNALTADLATGLTTAITKDGQTTTTARITFAQGITSSLTTDSSSVSTGSIITAGGAGIAKNLYVGGIASHAAGSAAAPTITATGDTNTGIFFPAADTIAFSEGGAEAMRIDSSSRVLIGSTSSVGNANANNLELTNPTGSGVCGLTLNVNSASANTGNIYWRSNASNNTIQIVGDPITNYFAVATAGSERLRIESAGNVGIGTTSPQSTVGVNVALADTKGVVLQYNGEAKGGILLSPTAGEVRMGSINATGTYFTSLYSNNAESMRILSGGAVCVNTTTSQVDATSRLVVATTTASGIAAEFTNNTSGTCAVAINNTGAATSTLVNWYAAGSFRSQVTWNGSLIVYGTSSDARLKENITDAGSGLAKLANVKIRSFDWKESGAHTDFGVVAQELQVVAPEAVLVGKDNEDGSIKESWSVDSSVLVPAMIKAIQELKAINDSLTARIVALESK